MSAFRLYMGRRMFLLQAMDQGCRIFVVGSGFHSVFCLFRRRCACRVLYAWHKGSKPVVWNRRRQFDHNAYLGHFGDHYAHFGGHDGVVRCKEYILYSMQSAKRRKTRNVQTDACRFTG